MVEIVTINKTISQDDRISTLLSNSLTKKIYTSMYRVRNAHDAMVIE